MARRLSLCAAVALSCAPAGAPSSTTAPSTTAPSTTAPSTAASSKAAPPKGKDTAPAPTPASNFPPGTPDVANLPASIPAPLAPGCSAAAAGTLDDGSLERADAQRRAQLLGCALGPYVGEADETAGEAAKVRQAKQRIVERLLARGVDVSYRGANESTLLMSAVTAKVPDSWKLDVVEQLLQAGVDPRARNVYGYSALDLAQAASPKALQSLRVRLGAAN